MSSANGGESLLLLIGSISTRTLRIQSLRGLDATCHFLTGQFAPREKKNKQKNQQTGDERIFERLVDFDGGITLCGISTLKP